MAEGELPFTDEHIRFELQELGHIDVDPEFFQMIKNDMIRIMKEQETESISSRQEAKSDSSRQETKSDSSRQETKSNSSRTSSPTQRSSSSRSVISFTSDPDAEERHRSRFQSSVENSSCKSLSSSEISLSGTSDDNRNADSSTQDTIPPRSNMLRRKAFKYVNGKRVLTEELRPLPHTSGKENIIHVPLRQKASCPKAESPSPNDLCLRMSTVSLSSKSSRSSDRSCDSRSSGVLIPTYNVKRKRCDPVSRYHEYRKYWDTFKLPGENNHKQLRWTIRERMLDYDFS